MLEQTDLIPHQVLVDEAIPAALRLLDDPPATLAIAGDARIFEQPAVAIVGSRRCSAYGRKVTRQLATQLSQAGYSIISGLATGIDGIAHEATLAAGGRTIAVVAHGLRWSYLFPACHRSLAEQILKQHGAIISEYSSTTRARRHQFIHRNRLISGLSLGVVVVEASHKSGALITARYALDQNREVFAVPGSVFQDTSLGTHALIQKGAKLVGSVADIIAELSIQLALPLTSATSSPVANLTPLQKNIINSLETNPLPLESLRIILESSYPEVIANLTELEILGIVRKNPQQCYEISHR